MVPLGFWDACQARQLLSFSSHAAVGNHWWFFENRQSNQPFSTQQLGPPHPIKCYAKESGLGLAHVPPFLPPFYNNTTAAPLRGILLHEIQHPLAFGCNCARHRSHNRCNVGDYSPRLLSPSPQSHCRPPSW